MEETTIGTVERKNNEDVKSIPFLKLFRYADGMDIFLMLIGTLGALGDGISMPLMAIIFGEITNAFGQNASSTAVLDKVSPIALKFVYLGLGSAAASFLKTACWMSTGERQAVRIRILYLRAILRQDIVFFDKETSTGEVVTRMSADTNLIQDAMGEKVGNFIRTITMSIGGFVVAFLKGWKLALVMLSVMPLLVVSGGVMATVLSKVSSKGQTAYVEAGGIVEQVLGGIRTVVSFNGEKKAASQYEKALQKAFKAAIFQNVATGFGVASTMFVMFASYSLAMWYGSRLILYHGYDGGKVVNVIFAVLAGGMSLGQAAPPITAFVAGKTAAYKMFQVMERTPDIDAFDTKGTTLESLKGDIELRNVKFAYPARPQVPVFDHFSLRIVSGTTAALVGESGSGKSTVISLIERFYDPQEGEVLIDNINVREFQLKWMRQQIGLVSQEPVLFNTSIKENIGFGKEGATDQEIEEAARLANVLKFLEKMPEKYDTKVGELGTQLSGGQKQRVAIARAILKNPRILLLDEATSALDTESEMLVQQALERIMQNRTTLIVAHRLSTIQNADSIWVVQNGSIAEQGKHTELLQTPDGPYSQLVRVQGMHQDTLNKTLSALPEDPDDILPEKSFSWNCTGSSRSITSFSMDKSLSSSSKNDIDNNNMEQHIATKSNDFLRLAALNKPETPIYVFGCITAAAAGLIFPIFGLLFSSVIGTFFDTSRHKLRQDANFWSGMFLLLAAACFVVLPLQFSCFGLAGQRLLHRIRKTTFENVLRQEIGWFDNGDNSSGALCARLSSDASHVQAIFGETLSMAAQNLSTITAGLIISLSANWILALLIIALLPLLGLQGVMQTKIMTGFSKDAKVMYEEATKVASNAVGSIRTVASYSMESKMLQLYGQKCELPEKNGIKTGIISGLGLGIANFALFGSYALTFWYGARLVKEHKTSFKDVFQVFFAVTLSALAVSQTLSMAPDVGKVKAAARSIFTILDRKSSIDSSNMEGRTLEHVEGDIEFRHVHFKYPTRPEAPVISDMSFFIKAGKTLALVGESGSGKSTVISLLERFYDPDSGQILIDGVNIKTLQLRRLRQSIGLVSQEPTLFRGSIRSNIAYGKDGIVTEEEIQSAAAGANADKFISSLPSGYDTEVGERGVQLSGGQKQRIAIARAVVKDPRILLLDEATSALDAESELVVQEALDRVMVSRTTVVVAHRLSTIVNADIIAVVRNGAIVEQGSHSDLVVKANGAYAGLHRFSPA